MSKRRDLLRLMDDPKYAAEQHSRQAAEHPEDWDEVYAAHVGEPWATEGQPIPGCVVTRLGEDPTANEEYQRAHRRWQEAGAAVEDMLRELDKEESDGTEIQGA